MKILKSLDLDGNIRNVKQNLFIMNLLFRGLLPRVRNLSDKSLLFYENNIAVFFDPIWHFSIENLYQNMIKVSKLQ